MSGSVSDRALLGGRYEFVKMLGKGGFGIVEQYLDHLKDNAVVAIKTIPAVFVDQESKRLVREVDIMLHLFNKHPYVMSFVDMFVTYSSSSSAISADDMSMTGQSVARPLPPSLDTTKAAYREKTPAEREALYVAAMRAFMEDMSPTSNFNLHIVMPLMKGDLLHFAKHVRAQNRVFPAAYISHVSVVFAFQICFGLDYMHKCNVVHRDLKPDNILICLDVDNPYHSIAMIADFGLARDAHETETFYICTRQYRPPEVITSTSKGERSIDIWSLGCILYELVTATTLFNVPSALNARGQWEGIKASQQLEVVLNIVGTPSAEHIQQYMAPSNVQSYLLKSKPRPNIVADLVHRNWKLDGTSAAEKEMWISLITSCLAFFPQQRPTAEELCRHVLFTTYNVVFGENVVQYVPRIYEPAHVVASSHKGENKASVLELLLHATRKVHGNVQGSDATPAESTTNSESSPVQTRPVSDGVKSGMRSTPASIVFPTNLDPLVRSRYESMSVASDSDVDLAIDSVLHDLELYTHDTKASLQLRALLNYFVALKQMHFDGEDDDMMPPLQIDAMP
jgi:serine/threonine protein kinase